MVIFARVTVLLFAVLMAGCATQSNVANSSAGTTEVFAAPFDEVLAAAEDAVKALDVEYKGTQIESDGTRILFSKGMSAFSWGEVGAVVVKPVEENSTLVTVDTEKRYKIQVTGTGEQEFSTAIFSSIRGALAAK